MSDANAPAIPGWVCGDGTDEEDHDWKFVSNWYGDPDVINGTADCSHWVCRQCGKEDYEREAPQDCDGGDVLGERNG